MGINLITVIGSNMHTSVKLPTITITSLSVAQTPTISAPTAVCSGTTINISTTGTQLYANGVPINSSYQVNSNTTLIGVNNNGCLSSTSAGFNITPIESSYSTYIFEDLKTLTGLTSSLSVSPYSETYRWSTGTNGYSTSITSTVAGIQNVTLSVTGICRSYTQTVSWIASLPAINQLPNLTITGNTTAITLNIVANTVYSINKNASWLNISGNILTVTTTPSSRMTTITVSSTVGSPQSNMYFNIVQLGYVAPTIPGVVTIPNSTVGTTFTGSNTIPTVTGISTPSPIAPGNPAMVVTINGSGFGSLTTLTIGGVALQGTVSGNVLLVAIPANAIVISNPAVTISNPNTVAQTIPSANINVTSIYGNKNSQKTIFEVYPNPTSGSFTTEAESATEMIEVYNSIGVLVAKLAIGEATLPKGFYLLKHNNMVKKLVVE